MTRPKRQTLELARQALRQIRADHRAHHIERVARAHHADHPRQNELGIRETPILAETEGQTEDRKQQQRQQQSEKDAKRLSSRRPKLVLNDDRQAIHDSVPALPSEASIHLRVSPATPNTPLRCVWPLWAPRPYLARPRSTSMCNRALPPSRSAPYPPHRYWWQTAPMQVDLSAVSLPSIPPETAARPPSCPLPEGKCGHASAVPLPRGASRWRSHPGVSRQAARISCAASDPNHPWARQELPTEDQKTMLRTTNRFLSPAERARNRRPPISSSLSCSAIA